MNFRRHFTKFKLGLCLIAQKQIQSLEMEPFYLRKFSESDSNSLYEAVKEKGVVRHMASEGFTMEDCETIIREANESWKKNGIGSWAVIDRENDKIIGWAGFKLWNKREVELLCVLQPSYWGIGKQVFRTVADIGFDDLALNEIYILLPTTRKTFRFVERMGFHYCGDESFNGQTFRKFVLEKPSVQKPTDLMNH